MIKAEINGEFYTLRYDMGVMEYMADEYGSVGECMESMTKDKTARKTLNGLFNAMCKAAVDYHKENDIILQMDVPSEIVKKSDPMWKLKTVATAIKEAIADGMKTTNLKKDDSKVRDLYLEEIEAEEAKKETPAGERD